MAKSKLKAALENFKGVDHKLERQRKLQKQAEKKKRAKTKAQVDNSEEEAEAQTNGKHVSEEQDSAAEGDWESDEEKGGAVVSLERSCADSYQIHAILMLISSSSIYHV